MEINFPNITAKAQKCLSEIQPNKMLLLIGQSIGISCLICVVFITHEVERIYFVQQWKYVFRVDSSYKMISAK